MCFVVSLWFMNQKQFEETSWPTYNIICCLLLYIVWLST